MNAAVSTIQALAACLFMGAVYGAGIQARKAVRDHFENIRRIRMGNKELDA